MTKRVLLLVAVVWLVISAGGVVFAQADAVFCGRLSAADCRILTESAAVMAALESAGVQFDLDLSVGNVPAMPDLSMRMNGSGAFAVDMARLDAITASPDALLEDPAMFPGLFETVLQAISADASMVLHLPELPDTAALPSKVGLDMRMVGGYAYVNLDKLAELDTEGTLPSGWYGLDLAGLYRVVLEQQPLDAMPQITPGPGDPVIADRFITLTRLPDETLNGQTVAVFETVTDVGGMFSDPQYRVYLRDALRPQMDTLMMPGVSLEEMVDAYISLLEDFMVVSRQRIGLEDYFLHGLGVEMTWKPRLGDLDRLTGGSGMFMPVLHIGLNLEATLERFNEVPVITVPEGAMIIPLDGMIPARPSA